METIIENLKTTDKKFEDSSLPAFEVEHRQQPKILFADMVNRFDSPVNPRDTWRAAQKCTETDNFKI